MTKPRDVSTVLNEADDAGNMATIVLELTPALGILENKCQSLERDNEDLKSKADDLENHLRWNNLRILGPEHLRDR